MLFAGCLSTFTDDSTVVPARSGDSALFSSSTVTGPFTMWGQPIAIALQDEDASLYTTSTSSSTSSSAAQPPSTGPSTPVQTSPTASSSPSAAASGGGLSTGAAAGIAVAAVLAVLTVVLSGSWFLRRRPRKQEGTTTNEFAMVRSDHKPEVDLGVTAYQDDLRKRFGELGELHTPPPELDSGMRAELPVLHINSDAAVELSSESTRLRNLSDASSPGDNRYSTNSMWKTSRLRSPSEASSPGNDRNSSTSMWPRPP